MVTILLLFASFAFLIAVSGTSTASAACPNVVFRSGPSAKLPDCRAYELVTPRYTAGLPVGMKFAGFPPSAFSASALSADGNNVLFNTVAGTLPGFGGNGNVDRYRARRTADEWVVESFGPSGEQAESGDFGGAVEGRYSFEYDQKLSNPSTLWPPFGGLAVAEFFRTPDGVEPIARGSLGDEPGAGFSGTEGLYISPDGQHVIFETWAKLEPEAPAYEPGREIIYDRTPGGETKVVSLLPGDVAPTQSMAFYQASPDGSEVAFTPGVRNSQHGAAPIYVRRNDETVEVAPAGNTFGGVFNGYAFYSDASSAAGAAPSDLFSRNLDTETTTQITNTDDAIFVNVSEDGSHVYFISHSQYGGKGTVGKPNLYVWSREGGSIQYIATVNNTDLGGGGNGQAGLHNWPFIFWANGDRAGSHTRSTPDGKVFAFESSEPLTGFNNTEADQADCRETALGKERCTEVYRYDTVTEDLDCVSCPPTAGPAVGEGRIQSINLLIFTPEPATADTVVESLTDDGDELFFETPESLVKRDLNETYDVYRWKKGEGVALISTGQNLAGSALYGVSANGSDVLFATRQPLLPQDENGSVLRIYDARVDGGFPPPESTVTEPCTNDVCQGQPSAAPEEPQLSSSSINGAGQFTGKIKCGKGLRHVTKRGKETCAPRKRHRRGGSHKGRKKASPAGQSKRAKR